MNIYYKFGYFIILFGISFFSRVALGYEVHSILTAQISTDSMLEGFVTNYMDIEQLGSYLISLMVAIVLSMFIAFHPQTFGKKEDINEIEAPKTLIFYAIIGSLVGATVADYGPELGFIFFGLGGLMRFRTNSGTSIQTGRLILVALIGLCCGLKMLYIAVISTLVCWILIYFLERKTLYHIEIKKIDSKVFLESVAAYRQALKRQKCKIIIEQKNEVKSRVEFIFNAPSKLHRESIEQYLDKQVAENNRGLIDWN